MVTAVLDGNASAVLVKGLITKKLFIWLDVGFLPFEHVFNRLWVICWRTRKGILFVEAGYRRKTPQTSLFQALYGAVPVKASHCVTVKSDELLWCLQVLMGKLSTYERTHESDTKKKSLIFFHASGEGHLLEIFWSFQPHLMTFISQLITESWGVPENSGNVSFNFFVMEFQRVNTFICLHDNVNKW